MFSIWVWGVFMGLIYSNNHSVHAKFLRNVSPPVSETSKQNGAGQALNPTNNPIISKLPRSLTEHRSLNTEPVDFTFPNFKALDLQPSETIGFSDASIFDPDPSFGVPSNYNVFYTNVEQTGQYDQVVSPNYYNNAECSPPLSSSNPSWPANGCICFQPDYQQTSFYEMSTETQDVPNNAFGYRTAFDTNVTGGLTVEGWFKASDTSGQPINGDGENQPGMQYSHILTRGKLASWGMGYNFGMGKYDGFRFEVVLNGNNGGNNNRLTAKCPHLWFPGIDVWHYVVATYDAVQGRIALYVDNVLQGEDFVDPTWTRAQRDIKWGTNEAQAGQTRIGNGYDANDKNFFGCTAGLALYGGAVETHPEVEECEDVASCDELQALLEASAADGGTAANICASTTPIDCRATKQAQSILVLTADTLGGRGKLTRAKCISNNLAEKRCILDMSPNYTNDPNGPYAGKDYSYTGILMRGASTLVLEGGFEFTGVRGNSNVNYVQEGSSWVCRGCIFHDIVAGATARGVVARDATPTRPCGPMASLGNIVFDQCLFEENVGELIYVRDSILTLKDSIFYNNTQASSVDTPRKGGFITYTGLAVNSFDHILEGNTFIDNDATLATNARWLPRGIPDVCKEDPANAGWRNVEACTSLLTKYTGNCQSGNRDSFDCEEGLFVGWPMNECVQFNTCSNNASPSLNDIYPLDESQEIASYIVPKEVDWSGSCAPSPTPSSIPSTSARPINQPSESPSVSNRPTSRPSESPSVSSRPSSIPSSQPSGGQPSLNPSISSIPSGQPSEFPSISGLPSAVPSERPSISGRPSTKPSSNPSTVPSESPSLSDRPTSMPSESPSISSAPSSLPSGHPSVSDWPTSQPSSSPSSQPSMNPTLSDMPSGQPSESPSVSDWPTSQPSESPSVSGHPSLLPSDNPSVSGKPSSQPSN